MYKFLQLAIVIVIIIYPVEGLTSRVYYQHTGESLEDISHTSGNVLVVKPSTKSEIYREERIGVPKGKEGSAEDDIVYTEFVELYEVVEVLKSKTIKPGDIIKAWQKPVYSYQLKKDYYERGIRRSFAFSRYEPKHPLAEGENILLFADDMKPQESVYKERGKESAAIKDQIATILTKPYISTKAISE